MRPYRAVFRDRYSWPVQEFLKDLQQHDSGFVRLLLRQARQTAVALDERDDLTYDDRERLLKLFRVFIELYAQDTWIAWRSLTIATIFMIMVGWMPLRWGVDRLFTHLGPVWPALRIITFVALGCGVWFVLARGIMRVAQTGDYWETPETCAKILKHHWAGQMQQLEADLKLLSKHEPKLVAAYTPTLKQLMTEL